MGEEKEKALFDWYNYTINELIQSKVEVFLDIFDIYLFVDLFKQPCVAVD